MDRPIAGVQRNSAVRCETFVGQDVFDDDPLALDDRAAADGGFVMTIPKILEKLRFESLLRHDFQRPADLVIELNTAEMRVLERDGGCQYLLQEGLEFRFPERAGSAGSRQGRLGSYRGEPSLAPWPELRMTEFAFSQAFCHFCAITGEPPRRWCSSLSGEYRRPPDGFAIA